MRLLHFGCKKDFFIIFSERPCRSEILLASLLVGSQHDCIVLVVGRHEPSSFFCFGLTIDIFPCLLDDAISPLGAFLVAFTSFGPSADAVSLVHGTNIVVEGLGSVIFSSEASGAAPAFSFLLHHGHSGLHLFIRIGHSRRFLCLMTVHRDSHDHWISLFYDRRGRYCDRREIHTL